MFSHIRVVVLWDGFFCCKQKTAYEMRISDWSSDVCSSDLHRNRAGGAKGEEGGVARHRAGQRDAVGEQGDVAAGGDRAAVDSVGEQVDRQAGVDRVEGDRLSRHLNETARDRIAEIDREIGRASCRERVCQYV